MGPYEEEEEEEMNFLDPVCPQGREGGKRREEGGICQWALEQCHCSRVLWQKHFDL